MPNGRAVHEWKMHRRLNFYCSSAAEAMTDPSITSCASGFSQSTFNPFAIALFA